MSVVEPRLETDRALDRWPLPPEFADLNAEGWVKLVEKKFGLLVAAARGHPKRAEPGLWIGLFEQNEERVPLWVYAFEHDHNDAIVSFLIRTRGIDVDGKGRDIFVRAPVAAGSAGTAT